MLLPENLIFFSFHVFRFIQKSFSRSYLFPNEIESFLSEKENFETINTIHVNIRSLPKHFNDLLDILKDSNYSSNILCITETWCMDSTYKNNLNLHLANFDLISQERKQTNVAVMCLSTSAKAWNVIYAMICVFLTKIRKFLLLKFQGKMIKIFSWKW